MLNFSKNLKTIRKKRNFTQKKLADALNVSQNAIFNWENGKREPSLEMIKNIATVLDVPMETLIGLNTWGEKFISESNAKVAAFNGVVAILEYIYGTITEKNISGLAYYLVEADTESFVITPEDIEKLLNYSKVSFPLLINELKDTRKEEDIRNELIEALKRIGEYNDSSQ